MITRGADPEFFLEKDGEIVSAIGKVGGTKEEYHQITELTSVHEDNVAIEITFKPASSEDQFVERVLQAVEDARKHMTGFTLSSKSTHIFDPMLLGDGSAKTFGCVPDYDAYTGEENPTPNPSKLSRECGGHVAVGYDGHTPDTNRDFVVLLDIILGVPSVLIDPDRSRRQFYGLASSYRDKEFGLEYRTLSNFWVFKEETIRWVDKGLMKAYDMLNTGLVVPNEVKERARNIINNYVEDDAKAFVEEFKLEMPNA